MVLAFCPEPEPKTVKNRLHLDLRLEQADDEAQVVERIRSTGGTVVDHPWGELPWVVCTDPSGNELCVLTARHTASATGG